MKFMEPRVILIGLDGINLYVTNKYMLPKLRKRELFIARLKSLIPPLTASAWMSIATGLSPGETGVLDYLNRKPNSYSVKPVSAYDYLGRSIWDIASLHGLKSIIIDYPCLYPPYTINGIITSGVGSPKRASKPQATLLELYKYLGDLWFEVNYFYNSKYNNLDLFFEDILKSLEYKIKQDLYLIDKNEDFNLFFSVISHTDWLFHRCWHIIYPNHPLRKKLSNEMKSLYNYMINYFFSEILGYLNEIILKFNSEANIFILSDHGFGSNYMVVNGAEIIRRLKLSKIVRPMEKILLENVRDIMSLAGIKIRLPTRRLKSKNENSLVGDRLISKIRIREDVLVDPQESILYLLPQTNCALALYVNLIGRDPIGKVPLEKYYLVKSYVRDRIYEMLSEVGVKALILFPQEIYRGSRLSLLPDILIFIERGGGVITFDWNKRWLVRKTNYSKRYTGSHRVDGLFMALGPNIRSSACYEKGEVKMSMNICDIVPLVSYMLDLPLYEGTGSTIDFKSIIIGKKDKLTYMSEQDKLLLNIWRARKKIEIVNDNC